MKRTCPKSLNDISLEWDGICDNRQNAIISGRDISLISVTAPCILRNITETHPKNILDAGCGTGYITSLVANKVGHCCNCWGIDVSSRSISIAEKNYTSDNVHFLRTSIEDFISPVLFDICISNMALISDPTYLNTIKKLYSVLIPGGKLFIMITHPCFWPKYWGLQEQFWFRYNEEMYIEHNFSISLVKSMGNTTYIHRPAESYINGLIAAGFSIECIEEPYPVGNTPLNYDYPYPRFLFIKCKK